MSTSIEMPVQLLWAVANGEANIAGDVQIRPHHFFLAILKLGDRVFADQLEALEVSEVERAGLFQNIRDIRCFLELTTQEITTLRRALRQRTCTGRGERVPTMLHRSPESRQVFAVAIRNAQETKCRKLTVLHVLEALFTTHSVTLAQITAVLRDHNGKG